MLQSNLQEIYINIHNYYLIKTKLASQLKTKSLPFSKNFIDSLILIIYFLEYLNVSMNAIQKIEGDFVL